MQIEEIEFETFKKGLLFLFKNHLNVDETDEILHKVSVSLNYKDLAKILRWNDEHIFNILGGELPDDIDLNNRISELEDKVENLEDDIDALEEENSELEAIALEIQDKGLHGEYKREFFEEYENKYTPWELEELLKNGRKYLNK